MNSIQKFEMMLSHMDNLLEKANREGVPLMVEEKKNSNGYIPKIEYWKGKLVNGSIWSERKRAMREAPPARFLVIRRKSIS